METPAIGMQLGRGFFLTALTPMAERVLKALLILANLALVGAYAGLAILGFR